MPAFALILFASVCPSLVVASPVFVDPVYGVEKISGLQYGTNVNGAGDSLSLILDLYQPYQTSPSYALPAQSPAIVLMHGGFFVDGGRDDSTLSEVARELAKRGFVAVSIDYRKLYDFAPPPVAVPIPDNSRLPDWLPHRLNTWGVTQEQYFNTIAAAVEDQATAVNWLADNAETYGVNPEWIVVGGFSAGAVSSLLLGAGVVDGVSADVGAVFSMAGGMFGLESFYDSTDPSVFLLHGTQDGTVPYSEIPFIQNALSGAGISYESMIVDGVGHSSLELALALQLNPDPFVDFMNTHLVPEPSTWALAVAGIGGFIPLMLRRRKKRHG